MWGWKVVDLVYNEVQIDRIGLERKNGYEFELYKWIYNEIHELHIYNTTTTTISNGWYTFCKSRNILDNSE